MNNNQNIKERMHRLHLTQKVMEQNPTPFYLYDMALLRHTLERINSLLPNKSCLVHYAIKANGNPHILKEIARHGLGADLVSGGELLAAIQAGFSPEKMNFSGVGKTDWEIRTGLERGIGIFNVESEPELEIINQIAGEMGKTANIAIRVNPDIDAHTHRYITTGVANNKFGIGIELLDQVVALTRRLPHLHLIGLHFHLGSQITDMRPFALMCDVINRLIDKYEQQGIGLDVINVGGGLGIDYDTPDDHPLPDFERYFGTFKQELKLRPHQQLHFELGRAITGQCGSLISHVTYVKENRNKKFVILDAGMNDLIRPALYDAHHEVQNLTSDEKLMETYEIVGPVCESSDVFAHECSLPVTRRGDIIAIRSAGAYGESMASTYNMRPLPRSVFINEE